MKLKNAFILLFGAYMASCSPKIIKYNPHMSNDNLTPQQEHLEDVVNDTNLPKISFSVTNKPNRGIYLYDVNRTEIYEIPANFSKNQLGEYGIILISKEMYQKIESGQINDDDKQKLFNSYLKGQALLSWEKMNLEQRNKFILLTDNNINPLEEFMKQFEKDYYEEIKIPDH